MNIHFCLCCGNKLQFLNYEGVLRESCVNCGWVYYPQLKVTAGAIIEKNNRLFLVQRALSPWKRFWNLPAGFIEDQESPEEAVIREVMEETGLDTIIGNLLDVLYYTDDPRGNGLVLLYRAKAINGQIKVSKESLDVGFFNQDEIKRLLLAGGSHDKAIECWLDGKYA